ncbi:MAG: AAA family ATPase [Smithella sp.]
MAYIWPIGGGKGGSGKSFLTCTLGRLLAGFGKKTLLIDLDLGAANLHTFLNVPYPTKNLSDFIRKKCSSLEDVILETPIPNLFLISGANDTLDIANLPYEKKMKTMRSISKLKYDCIFLDLGAGTSFNTLDFFLISQNGMFIATPEPTSIENIYRLIRSIYFRRIRQHFTATAFKELEEEAVQSFGSDAYNKPECIMQAVQKIYPDAGIKLENDFNSYKFKFILNQLRKQDDAGLGPQICRLIERHLGLKVEFVGNVAYDEHVHDAICRRISFLDRYPYTRAACDLRKLGKQIIDTAGEQLMFDIL